QGVRHRDQPVHRLVDPLVIEDLAVENASLVANVDDARREIEGGCISVTRGLITAAGSSGTDPPASDRNDGSGRVVHPEPVHAHQHLWQNRPRSYAPMTIADCRLWLGALYPLWSRVDEDGISVSTRIGLAELALGGCTSASDHLYLQRPDRPSFLDAQLRAASE